MAITKEDLQKLKEKVPHGGLIRIAFKLQCSKDWVYKVLSGKLENINVPSVLRVIEATLEMIDEMEQERHANKKAMELKNRINQLSDGPQTTRSEPTHYRAGHTAATEAI